MSKQSFIQGTMILLAAGFINRILGFVPRIALPRVIGAEGVGLYSLGYPLFIVILTVITGGIPLAVSKLVAAAESEGNEQRVMNTLKVSLFITVTLSLLFTAVVIPLAPWIASTLLHNPEVYYTLLAMCPMFAIIAVSSVFRGYFQGRQNMIPSAQSQIVETFVRIVAMLALAYFLLPHGLALAAAGAMFGVTLGELGGLAVLLHQYRKTRRAYAAYASAKIGTASGTSARDGSVTRRLLRIHVPVTGSRLVGSLSYFLESVMTMQALAAAGIAAAIATAQYGSLQGMVIPLILLPGVLTYSLSVSLVPSLSEAAARGDIRTIHKRLHQSLRLALVTGAPFAVLMYVLAEPLCILLYNDASVAGMLKLMAPVAIFIYFQGPLQATLQALDRPGTALLNTFYGAAIKLTLIYLLATQPDIGIIGVLIAINVNIVLVTLLHWSSIVRLIGFRFPFFDVVKTAAAAALAGWMGWIVFAVDWVPLSIVRLFTSGIGAVLLYLLLALSLKLIDKGDFGRLPWPKRK